MKLKCERCLKPFEGGQLVYSVSISRAVHNNDMTTEEGKSRYSDSMKEIFERTLCGDCAHTYKELTKTISDFLTPL